jgi:hypothetical protein
MVHVMEEEEVKEAVEETPEELLWDSLVLQAGTIASWWDQGLALTSGDLGPWNPGVLGALQKASKSSLLLSELERVPAYQAALLLTEHHLMQGDGALAPGLRQALATIASDNVRAGGAREDMATERGDQESVLGNLDVGEVAVLVRDWGKLAILQRVERVLAIKPWALNRFHIQEMQAIGLSISEIIQCVLIVAHFHALAGLGQGLNLSPPNHQNSSQRTTKSRSLSLQQQGLRARPLNSSNNKMAKRRRVHSQVVERREVKEEELICSISHRGLLPDPAPADPFQSKWQVAGFHPEPPCCVQSFEQGIGLPHHSVNPDTTGLERAWDDFGFPVLSCLSEAAALVLDNRFARLPHRSRGASRLTGLWTYAQHLFGCHPEGQCPQVTSEEKKLVVSCLLSKHHVTSKETINKEAKDPPLLVLVTVCEARMQAEILHGLEAVTQFMKS